MAPGFLLLILFGMAIIVTLVFHRDSVSEEDAFIVKRPKVGHKFIKTKKKSNKVSKK